MIRKTFKKAAQIFSVLLICAVPAHACTIFIKCTENHVLVGNNEDYMPASKSWLWVRPSVKSTNGYVLWGFEEKYPEGGMNDKGLFMDAAALPEKIAIIKDPKKPDFEGYITEKILKECSSVEQAISLVRKYNLTWQEKAQIMVADKSGDYAIIHANYIIRKTTPSYVLTNYRNGGPQPADFTCWRKNTVEKELDGNPPTVALFRKALSKAAQTEPDNATVYSQVCDLKNGTIYLYQKHNFNQTATLSLAKIFEKGRRDIPITALFPKQIGDLVTTQIQQHGVASALKTYTRLKNASISKEYDFSEAELDNAAYGLLQQNKYKEAIAVFRMNIKSFPFSANAKAGLANALLLQGDTHLADLAYQQVRKLDPSNYYLQLFSRRGNKAVLFELPGFDGAKAITVFIKNTASGSMITESLNAVGVGNWKASVKVPPGQYTYVFRVDDSYLIDPRNRMMKPAGKYLNSFLISR